MCKTMILVKQRTEQQLYMLKNKIVRFKSNCKTFRNFDVTGKVVGLERKYNELIFIVRVRGKDIRIGSNMNELKYDILS